MSRSFLVPAAWHWPQPSVSRSARIATSCSFWTGYPKLRRGSPTDAGTYSLRSDTPCCSGEIGIPTRHYFPGIGNPGVSLLVITTPFRKVSIDGTREQSKHTNGGRPADRRRGFFPPSSGGEQAARI